MCVWCVCVCVAHPSTFTWQLFKHSPLLCVLLVAQPLCPGGLEARVWFCFLGLAPPHCEPAFPVTPSDGHLGWATKQGRLGEGPTLVSVSCLGQLPWQTW